MLHLDALAPRTPRLPRRRSGALAQFAISAALHVTLVLLAVSIRSMAPRTASVTARPTTEPRVEHLVFLPSALPRQGGGGGGGNQQPGPIRRAQGVGSDTITLRTRNAPTPVPVATTAAAVHEDVPPLPSIVLDAKPLVSGTFDQIGLPVGAPSSGTSTGPGSGGGVGTGMGSGIGSGRGPGLGPGSGGGTGGGVYRPGGAVSAPRLLEEVRPRYTTDAVRRKLQGTVVMEVVITSEGCPSQIRIVKSLDRGGLDDEAVSAVRRWRFEPGRRADVPVDVLVVIELTFSLR